MASGRLPEAGHRDPGFPTRDLVASAFYEGPRGLLADAIQPGRPAMIERHNQASDALLAPATTEHSPRVVYRRSFTRKFCFDPRTPAELAEMFWSDPDRLVESGTVLKDCERTTVVRVDTAEGSSTESSWLLKRYNLRDPLHTGLHFVMRSRARTSWINGRCLCSLGISSPRPMAYLERRIGPLRTRSYLLTEFVPGTPLCDFARRNGSTIDLPDTAIRQFASLWHRFGQLRVTHGDIKLSNFLVTPDGCLWLIDLDSMRFHRLAGRFQRARTREWKQFMQYWKVPANIASALQRDTELRSATG